MKNLETTTDQLKRSEEGWCNYISANAANRDLWFCGSDGVQLFSIEYYEKLDEYTLTSHQLCIEFTNDIAHVWIHGSSISELHEKFDVTFCDVSKEGYKKVDKYDQKAERELLENDFDEPETRTA